MKLRIENWIDKNHFSEDTIMLFDDAIVCYKAGANRAALLFSYLAFMTVLKERIISGTRPSLFPESKWNGIISKLLNEDTWEKAVFDAVKTREGRNQNKIRDRDPIFDISESLRDDIEYWKNRRNDCAHYKDNIIDHSHVESFWTFIESNLSKITLEGGMTTLINKIKNHFNPTLTPSGTDITPLVQEIESSVDKTKYKDFWEIFLDTGDFFFDLSSHRLEFINRSLEINKDIVNKSAIQHIKKHKHYLKQFLSQYPDKILRLNLTEGEIRNLWTTDLADYNTHILTVYSSLLRNNLIPQNDIDEANKRVIKPARRYSVNDNDHLVLLTNNFLSTFKSEILNNSNFIGFKSYLWVNDRADLISEIIKKYPADLDILNKLAQHYNQSYNSDFLIERFEWMLDTDKHKLLEYQTIIANNNIVIPNILQKYFN